MSERTFRVWRGDSSGGDFETYQVAVDPGMVVLDVIHRIQAQHAGDLAVRWNCKAGKCGSCSMEINGKPRLGCMTRMNTFADDETVTIQPLKTFPVMKDLVCDVSWNYEQNKRIRPLKPRARLFLGLLVLIFLGTLPRLGERANGKFLSCHGVGSVR